MPFVRVTRRALEFLLTFLYILLLLTTASEVIALGI